MIRFTFSFEIIKNVDVLFDVYGVIFKVNFYVPFRTVRSLLFSVMFWKSLSYSQGKIGVLRTLKYPVSGSCVSIVDLHGPLYRDGYNEESEDRQTRRHISKYIFASLLSPYTTWSGRVSCYVELSHISLPILCISVRCSLSERLFINTWISHNRGDVRRTPFLFRRNQNKWWHRIEDRDTTRASSTSYCINNLQKLTFLLFGYTGQFQLYRREREERFRGKGWERSGWWIRICVCVSVSPSTKTVYVQSVSKLERHGVGGADIYSCNYYWWSFRPVLLIYLRLNIWWMS